MHERAAQVVQTGCSVQLKVRFVACNPDGNLKLGIQCRNSSPKPPAFRSDDYNPVYRGVLKPLPVVTIQLAGEIRRVLLTGTSNSLYQSK